MNERLKALSEQGVSVWLDDLSRERIETGNLADLMTQYAVVGVTTNPTIFQQALAVGHRYDAQVQTLAKAEVDVDAAITELTTDDVRAACDVLRPVFDTTNGLDGRVSIEVPPTLAFDTEGTIDAAHELWTTVDRPNLFIKIPATKEGLPAITAVLGAGISVNVTLIFGLAQYAAVMDAFLAGIEQAQRNGHDLTKIQSVASFFVSRVDTEIDARLEAIGTDEALELRGKAGIANAHLAYAAYEQTFASSPIWETLAAAGAQTQRPLWASTGVKNPAYPDTMYVRELIAPGVVNTMPEKTMLAFADHGEVPGDTVTGQYAQAQAVLDQLAALGVEYDDVIAKLESEGVEKFIASWNDLVAGVQDGLTKALA